MSTTRIKICGLTRVEDVRAAVTSGADAIGLVFYSRSPRHVTPLQAAALAAEIPPFVTTVGLFVNASPEEVQAVLAHVPLQLLQFHGDETDDDCRGFGLPWIRAARMREGLDLLEFSRSHPGACGLLLDAFVESYGGGGKVFDWSLIPPGFKDKPVILSGGLNAENVGEAVRRVRPWAVDVSSGVELDKGIKSADKIAAFIAGVRNAEC